MDRNAAAEFVAMANRDGWQRSLGTDGGPGLRMGSAAAAGQGFAASSSGRATRRQESDRQGSRKGIAAARAGASRARKSTRPERRSEGVRGPGAVLPEAAPPRRRGKALSGHQQA